VTLSAPADGVIRVRIEHHSGTFESGPDFALPGATQYRPEIDNGPAQVSLTSGGLTAVVHREGPWRLDFRSGDRRLTGGGGRTVGLVTGPAGEPYVYQQLDLDVGEVVYGLGERFGPLVKNGQTVDLWNLDGGTSSEQAYKNVPFYWTNRGYGVFVNHPERVSFEVGSEVVTRSQFSVAGEFLE